MVGKLFFMGHALMEYWHGLVVQADATETNGTVERKAALEMIEAYDLIEYLKSL